MSISSGRYRVKNTWFRNFAILASDNVPENVNYFLSLEWQHNCELYYVWYIPHRNWLACPHSGVLLSRKTRCTPSRIMGPTPMPMWGGRANAGTTVQGREQPQEWRIQHREKDRYTWAQYIRSGRWHHDTHETVLKLLTLELYGALPLLRKEHWWEHVIFLVMFKGAHGSPCWAWLCYWHTAPMDICKSLSSG